MLSWSDTEQTSLFNQENKSLRFKSRICIEFEERDGKDSGDVIKKALN